VYNRSQLSVALRLSDEETSMLLLLLLLWL
jgi:hypothetical protein